jgi:hypothetical protein
MHEIEIGGKHRPINFGIGALVLYCGEKGIPVARMDSAINMELMTLQDLTDLIYCALLAGYRRARLQVDFDKNDLLDWMDDTAAFARAMEAFASSQQPEGLKKKEQLKAGRKA